MGLMVAEGKVAFLLWVLSAFIRGPALGLFVLHCAGGRECVCWATCWLPFTFVWSIFCPDDLEQFAGPVCCPGSWVGEKGYKRLLFPSRGRLLGEGAAPSRSRQDTLAWPPGRVSWPSFCCCLFTTSGMVHKVWAVLGQDRDGLGALVTPPGLPATLPPCCDCSSSGGICN